MIVVQIKRICDDNHAPGGVSADILQCTEAGTQFHSVVRRLFVTLFEQNFVGSVHFIGKFSNAGEAARTTRIFERRTVDVDL
jgi:hypothetical protein